jgi:hypothetical protein
MSQLRRIETVTGLRNPTKMNGRDKKARRECFIPDIYPGQSLAAGRKNCAADETRGNDWFDDRSPGGGGRSRQYPDNLSTGETYYLSRYP